MMNFVVALVLILVSVTVEAQHDPAFNARYQVTFVADWSVSTHPVGFPDDPHFSGLIGATHNTETHLWKNNELATEGIQLMAETGSKFILNNEINALIDAKQAGFLISGGGIGNSPGSVSLNFDVSQTHPLVSIVSMIAPSPDWFIGVDALNLRSGSQWLDQLVVDLHAYDAGTDSGVFYTSADSVSNPPQVITEIVGPPFDLEPVLGQLVFNLIDSDGFFPLSGEHSGLYFNPENSGDGLSVVISQSDDRSFVLVTWYTYRNGEQMWLVGSADFVPGDTRSTLDLFRTTGAGFGSDFDADDVTVIPWGKLTLTVPHCGFMNIDFTGSENSAESGSVQLSQLAGVGDLSCD